MRLAVVAMIRNEADIVATFLQHLDALFDYALLMDHGSTDGTDHVLAAACAHRPGWTLWHLEPVGYHQTTFNTFALSHVMQNTDADLVLFLDADEFIETRDRPALEAAFAGLTDPDRVGLLRWRNAVPDRLDTRILQPGEAIWRAPGGSPFGKVVIPRCFFLRHGHEANLAIGNHALFYTPEHLVPAEDVGDLLHLPVRSHAQIKSKVLAGVFSVMAQAVRQQVQARHWFDIMDRLADDALRDEDLIGIAVRYGDEGGLGKPVSRDELVTSGYTMVPLAVPFGRKFAGIDGLAPIDPVRLVASILRRYQVENVQTSEIVLEGNRVRFVPRTS